MTRYRAKRGLRIPMPGMPGLLMPDSGEGIPVDDADPYFARLLADEDIVPAGGGASDVEAAESSQTPGEAKPAPNKGPK